MIFVNNTITATSSIASVFSMFERPARCICFVEIFAFFAVFTAAFNKNYIDKIKLEGIEEADLKHYKKATFANITKAAIDFSDAVIIGSETINPEIVSYLSEINKPVLGSQPMDKYIDAYSEFYDEILVNEPVLA